VIEHHILTPTFRLMTGCAVGAELAAMNVLGAMAAVAVVRQFLFCDDAGVASMAIDLLVFADECEFRIAIVFESAGLPSLRVVAALAFLSETRCMAILGSVTAIAVLGNFVLHAACLVTAQAIYVGVRAL
jgi:hypothetical protein